MKCNENMVIKNMQKYSSDRSANNTHTNILIIFYEQNKSNSRILCQRNSSENSSKNICKHEHKT